MFLWKKYPILPESPRFLKNVEVNKRGNGENLFTLTMPKISFVGQLRWRRHLGSPIFGGWEQGDQIGQIFAHWAIVFFKQFFKLQKYLCSPNFEFFSKVKIMY
jgi:hypothetical protein